MRCKVVGEGGNLGFTQLGRVEYALQGGLINTDFIDNSAGVDCSDHEVNIKILLNKIMASGELSELNRNELLTSMTNEVRELVLRDNFNQALVLSFSAAHSAQYNTLYLQNIKKLEQVAQLDRMVEFLPTDKQLIERKSIGKGLTRPELAILLAYTKIHIKNEILKSNLIKDAYFTSIVQTAFPKTLAKQYRNEMEGHALYREIVATQISNHVVNSMGITFAYRMQKETGATINEIARAHMIVSTIYDAIQLQTNIALLDFKIPVKLQYELLHHIRYLLNLGSRWFLRNDRLNRNISDIISHYRNCIKILSDIIPDLILGETKDYLKSLKDQFVNAGLSTDIAKKIAISRVMYSALNVTEVASMHQFDLVKTAKMYFNIGGKFGLVSFRDQLANDNRDGDLSSLARLALRDDLDSLQRQLTITILKSNSNESDVDKVIAVWMKNNASVCKRWQEMIGALNSHAELDYTLLFIGFRDLSHLISSTENHAHASSAQGYVCTSCHKLLETVKKGQSQTSTEFI